jgi:hypothetical protein
MGDLQLGVAASWWSFGVLGGKYSDGLAYLVWTPKPMQIAFWSPFWSGVMKLSNQLGSHVLGVWVTRDLESSSVDLRCVHAGLSTVKGSELTNHVSYLRRMT